MKTETNSINLALQDLYQVPFAAFKETYFKGNQVETAFPMLIGVQNSYEHAKYKVMICGQETYGWGGEFYDKKDTTIEDLVALYQGFTINNRKNSPYWNFIRNIKNKLRQELKSEGLIQDNNDIKLVYNNVVKIGDKSDVGCNEGVFDWSLENFNTLRKEIEILQPNLILFLSGNNYDSKIKEQLGKFSSTEIDSDIQLTKLSFDDKNLPVAYKCYHPGYIQRNGLYEDAVEIVFQNILDELK